MPSKTTYQLSQEIITLNMQLDGFAKTVFEKDLRIAELERELAEVRKEDIVPEGYVLVSIEPSHAVISAMACSQARDNDGEFPMLLDLIDFSGENKTNTALKAAYAAMIAASVAQAKKEQE